jgi:hypothetical protein
MDTIKYVGNEGNMYKELFYKKLNEPFQGDKKWFEFLADLN